MKGLPVSEKNSNIHALGYGQYTIQGRALHLETLWFPEYQIVEGDTVKLPWFRPPIIGLATQDAAIGTAFRLGMEELRFGDFVPPRRSDGGG
jgi:hypothetical protein